MYDLDLWELYSRPSSTFICLAFGFSTISFIELKYSMDYTELPRKFTDLLKIKHHAWAYEELEKC